MQPDEIYHLGAQSHVRVSFDVPEFTGDITGLGTTRILEAVRNSGITCRFYQAGSSEMFGSTPPPQCESTPFHPRSPYGAAKVYGHWMTVTYRDAYGTFASNGILFNHESPRRGETFVTRKITRAVAGIHAGRQTKLYLGNLDARRDWGYAPEYAEGMWRILQQDAPSDYVLGTGEAHTVREFLEEAFRYLDLDWREYVELDPRYLRPAEVGFLLADASKAHRELEWEPETQIQRTGSHYGRCRPGSNRSGAKGFGPRNLGRTIWRVAPVGGICFEMSGGCRRYCARRLSSSRCRKTG